MLICNVDYLDSFYSPHLLPFLFFFLLLLLLSLLLLVVAAVFPYSDPAQRRGISTAPR